jgi:hypothetical protein
MNMGVLRPAPLRKTPLSCLLAVLLACTLGTVHAEKSKSHRSSGGGQHTYKCWTNKEGVRECGNTVPPEYAQDAHEEVRKDGMTVQRTERAKTPEEIAAERAAEEEKARKQALLDEEARKKAAADQVLLATFSSEDDLILARDGQLSNVDSQIKLTESRIDKLQHSLDQMISRAADHERRGQQVPAQLNQDIASVREQISQHRAFIDSKQEEKVAISDKFARDLARFRELHQTPP